MAHLNDKFSTKEIFKFTIKAKGHSQRKFPRMIIVF